jgi:hypothetical protein
MTEHGNPGPPVQGGTATELIERSDSRLEEGDHERFAHYVREDRILSSAATGRPVVALCGKVWVPRRDPRKYPVCPICKEIFNAGKVNGPS